MGLFDHSAAASRAPSPDPSQSQYLRLSSLVAHYGLADPSHHAGSSERAAVELIGRFAFAEQELSTPISAHLSSDEARQRWKLGVIEVIRQLIPDAQLIAHHDYDQAIGMLGMVRAGHILFNAGVEQLKQTALSPHLDAVIKGLRRVHSVAGYDPHSLDPHATLAGYSFKGVASNGAQSAADPFELRDGEQSMSLDQAFARDAIVLMRLVHPLGLCPLLNIPGRTRMGFAGDRAGIDFGAHLGNVDIDSNGRRTKITYTPHPSSKDSETVTVRIQNGEAALLGRPLHVGTLFGIRFDPVSLEPSLALKEKEISRAAYLIVRDQEGGVYLFDRGARHSFGFWESYEGRERRYRFDPRATLRNDGRFTSGQTSIGPAL